MANRGWSCNDGARVIGVTPTRFPAAMKDARRKIALLMLADPRRTMIDLLETMEEIEQERFERETLPELERMRTGRADTSRLPTSG